ncbi:carbohydrate ABC transporter permease [Paenibacillus sp. GCM10027626]|uniref:carbohydrate ABC transporter permease n=1 Tax=Paenibacillus sp. GCM10027626 TaxID=3273411 RepID=UPI003631DD03
MSYMRQLYRAKLYYLFLLPTLIILLLFGFYPPLSALYHAFTNWNGATAEWIGLQNFRYMLEDTFLLESIWNMLYLLFAGLICGNVFSLVGAALVVNLKNARLSGFFRYMFILPMVVPGVVVLLLWKSLMDPLTGLFNLMLQALGLPHEYGWLGDPSMALTSMVLIGFPWVAGMGFLVYLAGFQSISQEVLEAAEVEGAVGIRRFFRIELPLVTGQIKLMIVLGIIGGLQGFGTQLVLTKGGPGSATAVPGWLMYEQAFSFSNFGYASMIGFVIFVVILLVTFINMKFIKADQ